MNKNKEEVMYPCTEVVILAGGQARRMNGMNKLLQKFDDQIQLIKIYQYFKIKSEEIWINSHRDHSIYRSVIPHVKSFCDDEAGFLGPLMGMKSAWSYVNTDYVLFIPCDITYIPPDILLHLHRALIRNTAAQVAYVSMNGVALYSFCLMKRSSYEILNEHLMHHKSSLRKCFQNLKAQVLEFHNHALYFQRINSLDQLQQHQQLHFLPK